MGNRIIPKSPVLKEKIPSADLEWLARKEDLGRQPCPTDMVERLHGMLERAIHVGPDGYGEFESYLKTCSVRYDVSAVTQEYRVRRADRSAA